MAKQILVVDDSKTIRDMVTLTLQQAGFGVVTAEDGKVAVDKANSAKFDVIITDLNMPNMNGFEFIKAMRASTSHKYTPILMLTTESSDDKKQQGKEAGASGWLVKPFNPEKLIQVISKVCPS